MTDVTSTKDIQKLVDHAVSVIRAGGVIGYPTEYCFGLGCDPNNAEAIQRVLTIKRRNREPGLILIASSIEHLSEYVNLHASPLLEEIKCSWPGPHTWLLPALPTVSRWVRGKHDSVAVRVTAHTLCLDLCQTLGGAIISTSANRHGQGALLNYQSVEAEMGKELDFVLDAPVGGASSASTIRDGITGLKIR